jgi:hypothetical protein
MKSDTIMDKESEDNAALVAAIGELSNAPKNADNPYFKSKYATLDSIIDLTRPVLKKHGLAISQCPVFENGCAGVITKILHKNGWSTESRLLLPLKDQSPQAVGGAITYARRYSFSVVGIASEEDDDGNVSTGLTKKEAPKAQERPAIAKVIDKAESTPRPAAAVSSTWKSVEITDMKIAAQSKEGAARKWTLYSVTFDGSNEAMTFDLGLYEKAKELCLKKVNAGVAPGKKDPSKWELVTLESA